MNCSFVVDQKVVCIIEGDWDDKLPPGYFVPRKDDVLTIKALGVDPAYSDAVYLRFHEVYIPGEKCSWSFRSDQFRPVKPTSIEVFRELLVVPPSGEPDRLSDAAHRASRKKVSV